MGFLNVLGKIAGGLTGLGGLFSKGAEGSAKGRITQAELQAMQDQLRNSQYGTQQNAQMQAGQQDLQRKGFTEQARGSRTRQVLIGDLLQNMKPFSMNVPGITPATTSGGLNTSAIGEQGRGSLAEMVKQAMLAQLTPDKFAGGQVLTPPPLTPLPQPSGWEKLQGILGTVGNIAGGIGSALPMKRRAPSEYDSGFTGE